MFFHEYTLDWKYYSYKINIKSDQKSNWYTI